MATAIPSIESSGKKDLDTRTILQKTNQGLCRNAEVVTMRQGALAFAIQRQKLNALLFNQMAASRSST
jgi:hypothetical protein